MKPIQVTQSSMPVYEDYIKEIRDLWDSGWLTNMGKKHQKLELELERFLNTPNVTLFTNGHLSLEAAIDALDLTGEVITTPFTFASTTQAIVRNRLTPVFCDINPTDFTINVDQIESLITEKTSAIIPVHVYGNMCDIDNIDYIAKKYNLKVIYDAAHAFGQTYRNSSVATFGDVSMFSLHATKVFNSIEGGALTYSDPLLEDVLNAKKNFGMSSTGDIDIIGGNAKMNEFQAAMGICNLKNIKQEIEKRKKVVQRYNEHLSNISGIQLNIEQPGLNRNYAYYPVVFDGEHFVREQIIEKLELNNIYARKYFYPLTNQFPCYKGAYEHYNTPIAERISENVLTLPLYADLAVDDVDRICEIILSDNKE